MSEIIMKTPESIEELIQCLSMADESTYLLGGGTDFMIKLRKNKVYSGTIIDLTHIHELNYIKKDKGIIGIGAITTFTQISNSDIIQQEAGCLARAASMVGSTQIRNAATIAGNIGNASPCADSITALMALNAKVKIINGKGEVSEKSIDEVVLGAEKNTLKKDEVIIEIAFPALEDKHISCFSKLGSRTAVTISKLNAAIVFKLDEDKRIEEARVTLGSLGPKAFRSKLVEEVVLQQKFTEDLLPTLQNALVKQVDTAISGRGSHLYKRAAICGIGDELFHGLYEGIALGGEELCNN